MDALVPADVGGVQIETVQPLDLRYRLAGAEVDRVRSVSLHPLKARSLACDLSSGRQEVYGCSDPDQRSRLPQHAVETSRDQFRPKSATGSAQPMDDRIDVQADESKCGAEQATNGEKRKTTHRPVSQVRKPARTSESADAQTRD